MRLLIKNVFRDKNTKEVYKVNSVVEFEEDRAKELLADGRNLVEEIKEAKAEEEIIAEEPKKATKKRTTKKSK